MVIISGMGAEAYKLAEIGALVGDPTRASILTELIGGRALTAGELATAAQITPQTVSSHLAKLADARLIRVERQGRHRYVAIASPEVAHMLEAMLYLTGPEHRPATKVKAPRVHGALKRARFCYDHVAGELGVALCDAWVRAEYLHLDDHAAQLTAAGMEFCHRFELSLPARSKRPLCRTCLDWSERRPHLAGQLGQGLAQCLLDRGWIERASQGRVVSITPAGLAGMREQFGIALEPI
ncbi:MAG TPA: winged helix-turn-helix domain-containing protein [Polyangiales bacterium]|nr:winged helix-turn-helix domain-containing protein [Polyangiales bacterium]